MVVSVVLVRPEHPGNVGAVARVMANFSASRLVLVDPRCNHLDVEARRRAVHAQGILDGAVVVSSLIDAGVDWLVATSAKLGGEYNVPRLPLTPRQLAGKVSSFKDCSVGVVFGPESSGLSNEEVRLCDSFVSILADPGYPVLNLSHAVAVLLYELFVAVRKGGDDRLVADRQLSAREKEVLYEQVDAILDGMVFATPDRRETERLVLRRLIGKAFLTRREAFALIGLFKKVREE